MVPEPAILAAVLAAPDDDFPRRVAADWLEDHAGTGWDLDEDFGLRAEFIRAQLDLAACGGRPRDASQAEYVRVAALQHRITEIMRWHDPFPNPAGLTGTEYIRAYHGFL